LFFFVDLAAAVINFEGLPNGDILNCLDLLFVGFFWRKKTAQAISPETEILVAKFKQIFREQNKKCLCPTKRAKREASPLCSRVIAAKVPCPRWPSYAA
jgi:hypothetical protein